MSVDNIFYQWEKAVLWLRNQPDKADLVLDCYYDDPLEVAAKRYYNSEEWDAVRLILRNYSGFALDIGAGRGIASYALTNDGFQVTALEPNPSNIVGYGAIKKLSDNLNLNIEICSEFSEVIPLQENSFDVVFARAVLHHTESLQRTCNEVMRVLKPGGIFLAIREHVISDKDDLSMFLEKHPLHYLYGGEHAYLLHEYTSVLQNSGFIKINIISPWDSPINFAPYTLVQMRNAIIDKMKIIRHLSRRALENEIIWRITCKLLNIVDNRPGRLYSFIAVKPKT